MIFSVIVPVYNAEKYIENMLKSILKQKPPEKSEIEVILVENGSTDKSPEICDSIADKYELVKCYHYGKIGAYAARNEGVRLAGGEWIIFADADDELSGEIFTEIYKYLYNPQSPSPIPNPNKKSNIRIFNLSNKFKFKKKSY